MIQRYCEPLDPYLHPNKVLVIYGPRRVGKTTLLRNYLAKSPYKYKLDTGDNIRTQQLLSAQDLNWLDKSASH